MFVTTIIAGYGAFSEILDHGFSLKELGLFVIAGYCMGLLYIICNEADHATRKVGLEFQERLLNVNLAAVDVQTQKEVRNEKIMMYVCTCLIDERSASTYVFFFFRFVGGDVSRVYIQQSTDLQSKWICDH